MKTPHVVARTLGAAALLGIAFLVPAAAEKTQCLDPDGDVEDPIGKGLGAYVNCARRIHSLVQLRFDESGLRAAPLGTALSDSA